MREALTNFGCDPEAVATLARTQCRGLRRTAHRTGSGAGGGRPARSESSSRSTARRAFTATVRGLAGHAGAMPMDLRRDALAAAAEMILAIEARARLKSRSRRHRRAARRRSRARSTSFPARRASPSTCARRATNGASARSTTSTSALHRDRQGAQCRTASPRTTHEASAYVCDPDIVAGLDAAVESIGQPACLCRPAPATTR